MGSNNKCTDTAFGYFLTVQMITRMINIKNILFANIMAHELKKKFVYYQ
jgi:hypothetical protein